MRTIMLGSLVAVVCIRASAVWGQQPNHLPPTDDQLTNAIARLEVVKGKAETLGARAQKEWKLSEMGPFFALDDGKVTDDMEILAKRWDDSRSERVLEDLASLGPKRHFEADSTLAQTASEKLILLRARRDFHEWMKGVDRSEDQVRRIRQAFRDHPDWLNPRQRPRDKWPLVLMLVERAEELSGADAVDLMVEAHMGSAMIDKYGKAVLEYAKRIGREKAMGIASLLPCIARSGNADAVPVLRQWLQEETDQERALEIVQTIGQLPGAGRVLRDFTNDPRPKVAEWARMKASPE